MRRNPLLLTALAMTSVLALAATGCGDDDDAAAGGSDGPSIVVTTPVLGDVVQQLVGEDAEVTVVMPVGADPHEFQASARDAAEMREADLLVINGAGFEAGLEDAIHGAEEDGVTTFTAIDHVDTLEGGHVHADEEAEGDEHTDDEAEGDEHEAEGDEHDDEGVDPHFFTDPARMAIAAEALATALADEIPELDTAAARDRAAVVVADLEALDAEVETALAPIPAERRRLVTNHDVFSYFADRYDFEVIGATIPATTTQAAASAGELDDLVAIVAAEGIPAIFADTSSPEDLADALAAEVGSDVEVVALYSESLGEAGSGADTYAGMMRTNAERIAGALAP